MSTQTASVSIFAQRLRRLEEVKDQLAGLRNDLTQMSIAERQQKADIYNSHMHVSHGERQGIASAATAQIATEILQAKGSIEILEDERRFLEFCVTWDAGG